MPSDANGVYSLPNGYEAVTGETIQASQHNPPLEDIATALTQRLMRTGAAPMTGPFKLVDGSASSPGLQFNSDSGTGLYKTASGFGVAVGGSQVAEFSSGGLKKGVRFLGELIAYTGSTAPALTVLPYGQTLNRADYPDFWTFVQGEIAAGNTSYNNGNGTTTFGILDMRGRAPFGRDNMGGTGANRITVPSSNIDGTKLGAAGGVEAKVLTTANLPPYTPSGSVFSNLTATSNQKGVADGSAFTCYAPLAGTSLNIPVTGSITFNGAPQGGTGTAFSIMPPTMICNYLLFVGA